MSRVVVVTNLENVLIVYVVKEGFSRVGQSGPAGPFPVNAGPGRPRHLGPERCTST